MSRYAPFPLRFEQKINKNTQSGCWIWTSASVGRYGVFWFNGGNVFAHRLSYELYRGEIPDGLLVCHTCDNGHCVNPDHLFLGTHKDNVHDCMSKGRRAPQYGEHNPQSKLSFSDIPKIFSYRQEGMTHEDIARMLGVTRRAIGRILQGIAWKSPDIC